MNEREDGSTTDVLQQALSMDKQDQMEKESIVEVGTNSDASAWVAKADTLCIHGVDGLFSRALRSMSP